MAEVTKHVSKARMWDDVLREMISQLPPGHELAGLTPEEVMEHYHRYWLQRLFERQERIEARQERIEEKLDLMLSLIEKMAR